MAGNFDRKLRLPRIHFRVLLNTANMRHGSNGFTSLPKEGVLRIFSVLKNPTASAEFGDYIHGEINFPDIQFRTFLWPIWPILMGRDIVVGIVALYQLDGPGILSRWGARFYVLIHSCRRAHPASYRIGIGSVPPGVKRSRRGVDHPSHVASRLKKE